MNQNNGPSLIDIGHMFDEVLPSRDDQRFVFAQLLDSIDWCERLGSAAWAITLLPRGFRLNVGQVEAMTCMFSVLAPGEFGNEQEMTFVDLRWLIAGEDCLQKLADLPENAAIQEMNYSSVGARHWCYSGTFYPGADQAPDPTRAVVAEHLDLLRPNHHAFLELACQTPAGNLRKKSNFAQHHCEALYAYALSVVGADSGQAAIANGREAEAATAASMPPFVRTRLEKAAADCGFERTPEFLNGALVLRSAQFPETVTVESLGDDVFALRASVPMLLPAPQVEGGAIHAHGWSELYDVLEKAAATARNMLNRIAQKFHQATGAMPKSTEAERLVVQRVGQNLFRAALLDYWQGRCCVTGLAVPELLRASHIKPWSKCDSDEERLDVFNGLLLAPHLDALFDGGWLTFTPDGAALWSAALARDARALLGVPMEMKLTGLRAQHLRYLAFHRESIFQR